MANRAVRDRRPSPATLSSSWLFFPTIAVVICFVAGIYAAVVVPNSADRVFFTLILVTPAIVLLRTSPTHVIDFFLVAVVVNREVRRLLDWGSNYYDKTPLLSITPALIAGIMLLYVAAHWRTLPSSVRRGGTMISFALFVSLAVGLRNGPAAVYALEEYATPLIVLFFAIACRPPEATIRRWMLTLLALGTIVAIYGIVQWAVVPQWDAEWDIWSTMASSMGPPVPFGMSICSTLESRGPAATFFASVTAIALGIPRFRRRAGIVVAVFCIFALSLTTARTGLIFLIITLAITAALQFRRGGTEIVILAIAIGIAGPIAFSMVPQGNRLSARVATLEDMQNDGSANVRKGIISTGVNVVLSHPLGLGLGSGGNASLLGTSTSESAVGDNGYLELLSTLGVVQTFLLLGGIFVVVRPALLLPGQRNNGDPYSTLGTAMFITLLPTMMVANMLTGCHSAYNWLLLAPALGQAGLYKGNSSGISPRARASASHRKFVNVPQYAVSCDPHE